MKKVIIPIISLLVLVLIFMVVTYKPSDRAAYTTIELNGQTITAEVRNTPEGRALGLSGHAPLEENEGMLFVFNSEGKHSFWMKDMTFAIDVLWINNGRVVDLWRDAQPPVAGEDVPRYVPGTPAMYVLEVPAGFTEEHNVRLGDEVKMGS